MDERDYKAMNEELKKPIVVLNDCYGKDARNTDVYYPLYVILEAMEEYADQFKKQLKEKEEQLAKSNEMADRLADQIGLFLNFGGKEYLEEALEQYQNSKK
jgi:hypothetical protein